MRKIFELSEDFIRKLKFEALNSPLKRSRIILHDSSESKVQEMIIALHRDSNVGIHKHPNDKNESYHIIEGFLSVDILSEDGILSRKIELSRNGSQFIRIPGGIWHNPRAISEFAIYHEVYEGSFIKEIDVCYYNVN